jgi:O-antigen/teichoic acid export membrane protein
MNFLKWLTLTEIREFFTKGHERSVKAKKNILGSFIVKGGSILINLLLVPLTLNYLNPIKYGIWITLTSVIAWFGFFDIGLGSGLRNRFAEAVAMGNYELAKTYISTTYAILSIIIAVIILLFYFINPFLNWAMILNAGDDPALQNELSLLALIVFSFFCFSFILKIIATILTADQQPAKASLFNLFANALSLIFIIVLTKTTKGSLLYLGIIFSSMPVLVMIISSIWFYSHKYKYYKPSIKFVDFSKAKDLFSLGTKFFIIQIAGVLIYEINNIIISQLFGPAEVTPYNIAFKYYSILMMFFAIIITPFWSAITEAWVKKEFDWIKLVMKKLFKFWGLILFTGIFMLIVSPLAFHIWVGKVVVIPVSMSVLVMLWAILYCWNGIFSQFQNGVGKIKLQLYFSILQAFIYIPLALFLGKQLGISGVLFANVLIVLLVAWIGPMQYSKIILDKATGIWND